MRRTALVLCLLWFMAPSFAGTAGACGQKFLVAGAGGPFAAFQQTSNPSAILIYRSKDLAATSALWDPDLGTTLEQAGHSVELAEGRDQLLTNVRDGQFDIVMMDVADAEAVGTEVASVSPGTIVLPSLVFPSRSEFSQAKRDYGVALKTPTTVTTLLSVIAKAGSRAPK